MTAGLAARCGSGGVGRQGERSPIRWAPANPACPARKRIAQPRLPAGFGAARVSGTPAGLDRDHLPLRYGAAGCVAPRVLERLSDFRQHRLVVDNSEQNADAAQRGSGHGPGNDLTGARRAQREALEVPHQPATPYDQARAEAAANADTQPLPAWPTAAGDKALLGRAWAALDAVAPSTAEAPRDLAAYLRRLVPLADRLAAEQVRRTSGDIAAHLDYLAERAGTPVSGLAAGQLVAWPGSDVVRDTLTNVTECLERAVPVILRARQLAASGEDAVKGGAPRAAGPRQIFHLHIMKCAGTSIGAWLDTLVPDHRCWRDPWGLTYLHDRETRGPTSLNDVLLRDLSVYGLACSDAVYSHLPLHRMVAPGTFRFTLLRDPRARIVSQIADWRRLTDADLAGLDEDYAAMLRATRSLSVRELLAGFHDGAGRRYLDNHITRSLAAGRVGMIGYDVADAELLLDAALAALEEDLELVGTIDEIDLCRNAICAELGLPPARPVSRLNVTNSAALQEEIAEAGQLLDELARFDAIVVERGRRLFDARHRALAIRYDADAFEAEHASKAVARLQGMQRGAAVAFSVRDVLVGSGMHGRDSPGTPDCAVWSGPERRMVLYLPVPPRAEISVMIWVRGYAADRLRDGLRLRVDGESVAHRFESADGWHEVILADVFTARDVLRLELEVEETLGTGSPGDPEHDPRLRGVSFDSYGWRFG